MFSIIFYNILLYILNIYSVYKIILLIKYVKNKLIMPILWKQIDYKNLGQWAVITGCTDGIGKAFTVQLAKLGINLVLISRSRTKLDDLAKELKENYGVSVKIIVADFKKVNEVAPIIKKELDQLDIGLLINNVGTALPRLINFVKNKKDKVNDMIEVNMKSAIFMCSTVLNGMVVKRKGVVINVASLLSFMPSSGATVYGATKAFILKFSKDLHMEYKRNGIIVHCLTTGPVVTKLFNVKITKWLTPSPEIYAKSALKTVGVNEVTTGYSSHDLIEFVYLALEEIYNNLFLLIAFKISAILKYLRKKPK